MAKKDKELKEDEELKENEEVEEADEEEEEKKEKKTKKAKKKKKKKKKKKENAAVVTRESICSTCLIFSLIAVIILCSRTLIFGEVGKTVHIFLTGLLGYFAYPLLFGALYLSFMGMIGKRLVKNRKLGTFIAFTLVFIALVVHTATTFAWKNDVYLLKCFNAGNDFPKATPCGWVGGLLVMAISLLVSKVGAIIVFAALVVFFVYLCITALKKNEKGEEEKAETPMEEPIAEAQTFNNPAMPYGQPPYGAPYGQPYGQNPYNGQPYGQYPYNGQQSPFGQPPYGQPYNGQAPVYNPSQTMQGYGQSPYLTQNPQMPPQGVQSPVNEPARESYQQQAANSVPKQENSQPNFGRQSGYQMPQITQRPGVSLDDNGKGTGMRSQGQGFSPFSVPQNGYNSGNGTPQNNREILFGGSAAENFKKNLIFDPNARVNQRTIGEATPPSLESSYTPSYTDAFENSVNAKGEQPRPAKIVNDYSAPDYRLGGNEQVAPPMERVEPTYREELLSPTYRLEEPASVVEPPVEEERGRGLDLDRAQSSDFGRDAFSSKDREALRREENPTEEPYRRHDYMDLFSPSNPNVFGNDEEEARKAQDFADRALGRFENTRGEDTDRGGRDGLNLLDEEEDPYTLRSDFDITSRNADRGVTEDRGRGSEIFDDTRRGGEEPASRGRDFEEEPPQRVVEPPKPVVEPPKAEPPKPRIIRPYVRPRLDDFDCRDIEPMANDEEVRQTKENIIATLEEFKIMGASIASVTFGPTVTRYNVTIPRSISPKKVIAQEQSIAMYLRADGINIYPNYEDGVVSIEVPNKERQFVQLGCMLSGDTFVNAKSSSLMFAMGKDVANRKIYGDVSKMIHMLVAGSSGSGKSVFLGSLIVSLIYKYSPEELRLILIDPKKTEFVLYNNLPHLMINEIITDAGKAVQSLNWAIGEMNRRYSLFEKMSRSGKYVVNLDQYNEQLEKAERLPKIVIIIDELADLMLAAKKEMEDRIQNLTQKARAAGIHLIVATQRPSTDVITGVIKSNLATRVAFYVASDVDSRVILDQTGAQKLLGKGDLLYTMPGINVPVRVQSAFISPEESQRIVNFIKSNNEAYYDEEATMFINSRGGNGGDPFESGGNSEGSVDPMYIDALRYVIQSNSASISMIQRKCSAGYNRAGKIIEWMEDMGYISPFDGAKARKVLITKEEFESKYGPL